MGLNTYHLDVCRWNDLNIYFWKLRSDRDFFCLQDKGLLKLQKIHIENYLF